MFDEVAGLPAHPLMVHFPVVLVLGLSVVAVGYALVPVTRRNLEWVLTALAVAAPLSVALARESGESFRRRLAARAELSPEVAGHLVEHAALARALLVLTLVLAGASLGLVFLERAARRPAPAFAASNPAVSVLRVATCVLAVATAWYLIRTGHTGSYLVWNGS